jgi:hypothetical protein
MDSVLQGNLVTESMLAGSVVISGAIERNNTMPSWTEPWNTPTVCPVGAKVCKILEEFKHSPT